MGLWSGGGGLTSAFQSVAGTLANLVGQNIVASMLRLTSTGAGPVLDMTGVSGAGVNAMQFAPGGGINFAPADGASYLRRTAANVIKTDGNLTAATSISAPVLEVLSQGDSTGTPGNATLNTGAGRSACAAAASTVTVTNNKVTANDCVLVQIQDADATATRCVVTTNTGNFVVTFNAAATATTKFYWVLFQQ